MTVSPAALHQPPTTPEEILTRLFRPMGVDGVYSRTGAYEDVVDALGGFINRLRPNSAEVFRFPPVVSRALIEKSGYLASFPHLLGCVCALGGDEARVQAAVDRFTAGGTWTDSVDPSELVLAPAACYPIYPIAAARGPTPPEGLVFDVAGDCFRREPSREIDRLQSFRMREFVAIGPPEHIRDFRDHWIARAPEIAGVLGLSHRIGDLAHVGSQRANAAEQMREALEIAGFLDQRAADDRGKAEHLGALGTQSSDIAP